MRGRGNAIAIPAFKFKKRCPTVWLPSFCDSTIITCEKPQDLQLTSTDSGIIYCQKSGGTFYLPYFKNYFAGTSKPLYIISDVETPKFLALKGFEWSAIYSVSSSTYMAEEFCNATRFESQDCYFENFMCSIITDESLSEINVTCAVHLQTGKMVQKTSSEKFNSSIVASDSPNSKYSSDSPHSTESAPTNSEDWPPILIAIAGMAEVPREKIKFEQTLLELKIMSFVGKHDNIVELVGANTERIRKQAVFLIYEFCENGNVLEYICVKREGFVDQFSLRENANGVHNIDSTVVYENGLSRRLCSEDLIRWATEIATGMDFIASKNVYHGDLAARNILLTRHLVAKVGDFGLAKDLKDYALYVQRMNCPLPLKW
ncbi:unnamed protein product, partial [Allacma fusca]